MTFDIRVSDAMDFLRSLPDDSIDLIFGSPFYSGKGKRYGNPLVPNIKGSEWAKWVADVMIEGLRCSTGLVAFVVDAGVYDHRWDVAVARLIVELDNRGVHQARAALYRRNGTPGNRYDLRNDYEWIVRAKRPGRIRNMDIYACAKPPLFQPGGGFTNRNAKGERAKGKPYKQPDKAVPSNSFMELYTADEAAAFRDDAGDAAYYPNGGGHLGSKESHQSAAPFSERLADFYVRTFSRPGSTVADPFSGSGTVAAAAMKAGRNFVGCDIDPEMVRISRNRCALLGHFPDTRVE